MPGLISIEVPPLWERWTAGFAELPTEMARAGHVTWAAANAAFYAASQDMAHIDTGEMKASGHHHTEAVGHEVVAELVYDSDHAIFEQARGGDHAFLSRAWEQAEPGFAAALPAAFEMIVASWR